MSEPPEALGARPVAVRRAPDPVPPDLTSPGIGQTATADLLHLVEAMHDAHDVDDLGHVVLDGLHTSLGVDHAAILWFGDEVTPPSGRNLGGRLAADVADAGRVFAERLQIAWDDGGEVAVDAGEPGGAALQAATATDADALCMIPIAVNDRVLGALVAARPSGSDDARLDTSWWRYVGRMLGHVFAMLRADARRAQAEAEQQKASDRLRASVDEMTDLGTIVRSIADAINVAVMFYDTDNHPKLHNRMVEKILGLTGYDPATGMSTHVYASDRRTPVKRDKDIVSETVEGDQRGVIYWVGDPEGGEQRAVITEAHRIGRPDGVALGTAVVTYDVTDLANAIDAREEYLTMVSHELRTPLTSIVGYLDLISDTYDLAGIGFEHEFQIIQRNAEHLVALVHDLASADVREQRLRIEPVDLGSLILQAVGALRPAIDEAGHDLRLDLPPMALLGRADAVRIGQVIGNIVSNAVKYTPRGGTITVSLVRDGDDALLRVSDTGRGIAPGDQGRIFDRFFRADDVREAAIQGVGVGLTIAKTIVAAHGGTITVASEPGTGSTFTVRLPLRPSGAPLSTVSDQL